MKKLMYDVSLVLTGKNTYIEGFVDDGGSLFAACAGFSSAPKKLFIGYGTKDDISFTDPNYESLARVLKGAYNQAASGKGRERHANDKKFEDQPIMTIAKDHGLGFLSGQAEKKLKESHTLLKLKGKEAAIRELYGVINYTAALILAIENLKEGE